MMASGEEIASTSDSSYFAHFPYTIAESIYNGTGLTIKAEPPNKIFCDINQNQCGPNYVSPGYDLSNTVPLLTKRLQG